MKNLDSFGVQEMDTREIKGTDGGGWLADAIAQWKCGCPQTKHTNGQTYPR